MSTIPVFPSPAVLRAEKAHDIGRQARALVETLDGFTFLTAEENIRLSTSARVPDPFLELTALAIEQQPKLAGTANTTPAVLRDAVVVSEANNALADELELLARGVRETTKLLRSEAGTEALRIYAVAQKMTRPRDSEQQVRWLDQMRRTLNSGRKGTKPADPVVPETPAEEPRPKPQTSIPRV